MAGSVTSQSTTVKDSAEHWMPGSVTSQSTTVKDSAEHWMPGSVTSQSKAFEVIRHRGKKTELEQKDDTRFTKRNMYVICLIGG
jgi:hypothetical protein